MPATELEQNDAGCHRHVQGLNGPGHGDGERPLGSRRQSRRHTTPLGAQHQDEAIGELRGVQIFAPTRAELHPERRRRTQTALDPGRLRGQRQRETQQAARRSAQGPWMSRMHRAATEAQSGRPGRLGDPGHGAEVAGILDTVDEDHRPVFEGGHRPLTPRRDAKREKAARSVGVGKLVEEVSGHLDERSRAESMEEGRGCRLLGELRSHQHLP